MLDEVQRRGNYAYQRFDTSLSNFEPTPRQRRRIKHKQFKMLGNAPRSRKQRYLARLRKINHLIHIPCPTCGATGPWSSNPCQTSGGNDAKKAHAGRVL